MSIVNRLLSMKLIILVSLLFFKNTLDLSTETNQISETVWTDIKENSASEEVVLDSNYFQNNLLTEVECQYSKTDSICPVCLKIDKVIPIVYGYLLITQEEYQKEYSKNLNEDLRSFKSGGCEISGCDPFWYCKRDSISF